MRKLFLVLMIACFLVQADDAQEQGIPPSKVELVKQEMRRRLALQQRRASDPDFTPADRRRELLKPMIEANVAQYKRNIELANAAAAKAEEVDGKRNEYFTSMAKLYAEYAKQNYAIANSLDEESGMFDKASANAAQAEIERIENAIARLNKGKKPKRDWLLDREFDQIVGMIRSQYKPN